MRWRSRIRNLRHWVLCKTTAPIDNATLTDTIFFSPTLKGGKLFIVSCEFWFFLHAKIFFSHYVFKGAKLAKFIRFEAGWKLMWDDVMMWWCDNVVMRWRSRIKNMRHWVLCKTTAPKENTTLTDTIFFSPTLKGGKLFIVSCEFWVFLYAKIFYFLYVFKGAKLAKFIREEAGWKLKRDEIRDARCEMRDASISITKFTEMGWNDCVFEGSKEHLDVLGSALVFQFIYVEKNLFYYKEILHFATLRSEWQSFGL